MDSKTPVTLLQELLLKKGCTPDYVLVHNGVGTHNPLFVYEVTGLGQTATGRGKSKREAKHAAAQELLYSINACDRPCGNEMEEVVQSPYADMLKDNAVGALQDFCCTYKINPPTYEQTRDEGLPHAKLFGMKCRVSNLSTIAEARTKKQAKQMASQLMLAKLKDCLNDQTLDEYKVPQAEEGDSLDNLAVEKVKMILDQENKLAKTVPLGTPFDFYDQLLKDDLLPFSEVLERLKTADENFFSSLSDPLSLFVQLTLQLELHWDQYKINTKDDMDFVYSIQIDALSKATFFGKGRDEEDAVQAAALSALKWFSIMAV